MGWLDLVGHQKRSKRKRRKQIGPEMPKSVVERVRDAAGKLMGTGPVENAAPAQPVGSENPKGGDELYGTFTGGYGTLNREKPKAAPKKKK